MRLKNLKALTLKSDIGVPACSNVLKGVKDFSIVANLTDETLLAT